MRKIAIVLCLTLAAALPAAAQQKLNLDFPGLADRADEVVDITLDASMLKVASAFLGKGRDEQAAREMISGLQGIYVRSYQFAKEGEYDRALGEKIKAQLGTTWKPLVTVRSKTKENVNIFADMRGEKIVGMVVIAAEPKEFTVVNIVGPIDMERLADLEGQFGIPHVSTDKEKRHE